MKSFNKVFDGMAAKFYLNFIFSSKISQYGKGQN